MKTIPDINLIPDPSPSPSEQMARAEDAPRPFERAAALCRALASLSKTEAWCALQRIAHPELPTERIAALARVSAKTVRQAVARLADAVRADAAAAAGGVPPPLKGEKILKDEKNHPPGVGSSAGPSARQCVRRGGEKTLTNAEKAENERKGN